MKQRYSNKVDAGEAKMLTQYHQFRDDMLKQEPGTIYTSNYKIAAIENFVDCLRDNLGSDERADNILVAFADDKVSLEMLYSEFLEMEQASFATWEDVLEFFEEVLKSLNRNKEWEENT